MANSAIAIELNRTCDLLDQLVDAALINQLSQPSAVSPSVGESLLSSLEQIVLTLRQGLNYAFYEHNSEGLRWLQYGLAAARFARKGEDELSFLFYYALTIQKTGRVDEAVPYLEAAVALARTQNNLSVLSSSLNSLGVIKRGKQKYYEALEIYQEALKVASLVEDYHLIAGTYSNFAVVLERLQRSHEAESYKNKAIAIYERLGDRHALVGTLGSQGVSFINQSRLDEAVSIFQRGLTIAKEINYLAGIAQHEEGLGQAYSHMGRYEGAASHLERAVTIYRSQNAVDRLAITLEALAVIYYEHAELGKQAKAKHLLADAVQIVERYKLEISELPLRALSARLESWSCELEGDSAALPTQRLPAILLSWDMENSLRLMDTHPELLSRAALETVNREFLRIKQNPEMKETAWTLWSLKEMLGVAVESGKSTADAYMRTRHHLLELARASSWPERQEILSKHPALLTKTAQEVLLKEYNFFLDMRDVGRARLILLMRAYLEEAVRSDAAPLVDYLKAFTQSDDASPTLQDAQDVTERLAKRFNEGDLKSSVDIPETALEPAQMDYLAWSIRWVQLLAEYHYAEKLQLVYDFLSFCRRYDITTGVQLLCKDATVASVTSAIERFGDVASFYAFRAELQEDGEAAVEDLTRAIKMDSTHRPYYTAARGLRHFFLGQFANAETDLLSTLDFYEYDSNFYWLGRTEISLGNYTRAVQCLSRAIHHEINVAGYYYWRAYSALVLGDYADAQADIAETLALNPGEEQAHWLRAIIGQATRQFDAVVEHLQRELNNPELSSSEVSYWLGQALLRKGDAAAEESFERAATQGDNVQVRGIAYLWLAVISLLGGKQEQAEQYWLRIKALGSDALSEQSTVLLYLLQQDYHEAQNRWQTFLASRPLRHTCVIIKLYTQTLLELFPGGELAKAAVSILKDIEELSPETRHLVDTEVAYYSRYLNSTPLSDDLPDSVPERIAEAPKNAYTKEQFDTAMNLVDGTLRVIHQPPESEPRRSWISRLQTLENLVGSDAALRDFIVSLLKVLNGTPPGEVEPLDKFYSVFWKLFTDKVEERPSGAVPELRDAVISFCNAESWLESKRVLEASPELLNTDESFPIIDAISTAQSDKRIVDLLRQHKILLGDAKARGIESAFKDRIGLPTSPFLPDKYVYEILRLDTDEARRAYLEIYSGLKDMPLQILQRSYRPSAWGDMTDLIGECQIALHLTVKSDQPDVWAALANALAIYYYQNAAGDRNDNLRQSIRWYHEACSIHTRERNPQQWALTQVNIGIAYLELTDGGELENIRTALEFYEKALPLIKRDELPDRWAQTHFHIAQALKRLNTISDSPNWSQPIEHYEEALIYIEARESPELYKLSRLGLGRSYLYRFTRTEQVGDLGEAIDNLSLALPLAVEEDEKLDLLNDLASAHSQRAFSSTLEGPLPNELEMSIRYYLEIEERLAKDPSNLDTVKWANLQHNLCITYLQRISGDAEQNELEALIRYKRATEFYNYPAKAEDWFLLTKAITKVYLRRYVGRDSSNYKQARNFAQLICEHAEELGSKRWLQAGHTFLMETYWRDQSGNIAENRDAAVKHAEAALKSISRETETDTWVSATLNLANMYTSRLLGERADNIEKAINYSEQVKEVLNGKQNIYVWLGLHNNLGLMYRERIYGIESENRRAAVKCFEEVLDNTSPINYATIWASANYNLGNTLAQDDTKAGIYHLEQALRVWDRNNFPQEWAKVQRDLGNAYDNLTTEEAPEWRNKAIEQYRKSLEVLTAQEFPADWATSHSNLAYCLFRLADGDREENLGEAKRHLSLALTVRLPDRFPEDCMVSSLLLGRVCAALGDWAEAVTAFETSIGAAGYLFAEAYTPAARYQAAQRSSRLYRNLAYCLLKIERTDKALLTLEQGRTKLLTELLSLDELLRTMGDTSELRAVWQMIQQHEVQLRQTSGQNDRELIETLQVARKQLAEFRKRMNIHTVYEESSEIHLQETLDCIPDKTAVVNIITSDIGAAILLVRAGSCFDVRFLDGERLQSLTYNWLISYVGSHEIEQLPRQAQIHQMWRTDLQSHYPESLWEVVFRPVSEILDRNGCEQLLIVPSGMLHLLPFHASFYSKEGEDNVRYLIDYFDVAYIPSLYIWKLCVERAGHISGDSSAVIGIDAYLKSPSLNYAVLEAQEVAKLFDASPLLNEACSKDGVYEVIRDKNFIHFACHGEYIWSDPQASALILAADERLTLSEIRETITLDRTRLVTLSACETGLSDVRQEGDEVMGLSVGFIEAGTPGVISTLWPVDDLSTLFLMTELYRQLLNQTQPSKAIRQAQLYLRNLSRSDVADYLLTAINNGQTKLFELYMNISLQGNPDDKLYSNPYHWAAFVLNGT